MNQLLASSSPIIGELTIICISVAIIAVCAVVAYVWDKPPWTRTSPTERTMLDMDREYRKRWRLRQRNKKAFADPAAPPLEHSGAGDA